MSTASFTQITARIRNDDGNESGATWRQAQGVNDTVSGGVNFRVRFRVDETASVAWTTLTWNLRYSQNGGAYTLITTSTPVQLSLSSNFANGDDCTTQLTGGTGTFVTDNNGMRESSFGTNSGTAGQLFEIEVCLKFDTAQVAAGDTFDFRVYNGSSAIAAYTVTPRVTVGEWQRTNTDTASAADTRAADGTTSQADTGSAADTRAADGSVSLADTASAADSNSTINIVSVADTASASDSNSVTGASSFGDTASAGETQSLSGAVSSNDTGTASDAYATPATAVLADTASAGDVTEETGSATLADTAAADETQATAAAISQSDTASAAESLSVAAETSTVDTAAAGESQTLDGALSFGDAATAGDSNAYAETGGGGPTEVTISDTASASDAFSLSAESSLADIAASSETQDLAGSTEVVDTASATDEFLGHVDFLFEDTAAAADINSYLEIPQIIVIDQFIDVAPADAIASLPRGRTYINVASGRTFIDIEH